MTADQNKELVRRFYEEVWDRGNFDFAREVFADDYVRHDLRASPALPGPEGQAKIAADFRAAFPDLRLNVDMVFGEGEMVAGNGPRPARTPASGDRSSPAVSGFGSAQSTCIGSPTGWSPRSGTTGTTWG